MKFLPKLFQHLHFIANMMPVSISMRACSAIEIKTEIKELSSTCNIYFLF